MHYSLRVSQAIPPSSLLPPVSAATPTAASTHSGSGQSAANFAPAATAAGVPPPSTTSSGAANVAQVASIVAAAQSALANTVNLSPQAQQAVKFEAFNQLVTKLVSQIQSHNVAMPSQWPAGGVTPALHQLVSALLQQATAGQPLPQQLTQLQSWPSVLAQAVLQHAGHAPAQGPSTASAAASARAAAPLPPLQTWLVQQGSVQAADGERAFTLTLRVPVAWAQAQAALGTALASSTASTPSAPLLLPFSGSVQQLASGSMGLVMQPQALPGSLAAAAAQAMRTSALLQLEFQPLAQSLQQTQAAAVYQPGNLLPQDVQAMLQGRGQDPWVLMAQAHADGQHGKQPKHNGEQAGLCNRAGCQYEGRATCAQPFCAEMNYLWSIARAQRRS